MSYNYVVRAFEEGSLSGLEKKIAEVVNAPHYKVVPTEIDHLEFSVVEESGTKSAKKFYAILVLKQAEPRP